MALTLICAAIVVWILSMSVKFYRRTGWDEPVESSPDFADMHKREAQLLHIQEVLQEARDLGKISQAALEEYIHYAESEIAQMKTVQKTWGERKQGKPQPQSD